jgi:AcrR family transcriptional regulator
MIPNQKDIESGCRLTNRQREALETRKSIIEASRKLISERGFDAVSMDDIAAEAGVSKGSFYTYFRHKEDIIYELNKQDFYILSDTVSGMDAPLMERMEYYCVQFMSGIERGGIQICRQWIRNNVSPTPIEAIGNVTKYEYDRDAMVRILQDAVERGELVEDTPIGLLAVQVTSHLYGIMLTWCMSDADVLGTRDSVDYCKLFVEGALRPFMTSRE